MNSSYVLIQFISRDEHMSIPLFIRTSVFFLCLKENKPLIYLQEGDFWRQLKCWVKLEQAEERKFYKFKKKACLRNNSKSFTMDLF